MESFFLELGLILLIATILGFVARMFKQPLILAYIITGIIAGPTFLNLIQSEDLVSTLSTIGVAFLLFIVGINLNFRIFKEVGLISLLIGLGQVLLTFIIGYFILIAFGFSSLVSMYISIALTFSSTIIIIKLLSDKNDLETLYGKITIGILLVQDFIAITILLLLSGFATSTSVTSLLVSTLIKGLIVFLIIVFASKFFLPKLFENISKSQELLFLSSIAWCLFMAILSYGIGFSVEIGAFLAGISLSMLPYHYEIEGKVKPLRDFFLVLFFVLLGAQMKFLSVSDLVWPIIILSLFVILKPIIIILLMWWLGYKKRTGFMSGLTIAQISEFSLILMAVGLSLGHLSQEVTTMVTVIGLVTIALSTYMIIYNNKIYNTFSKYLEVFERKLTYEKKYLHYSQSKRYDIILMGCHRIGYNVIKNAKKIKKKILVVDFNPDVIKKFVKSKVDALYGDISDRDILEKMFGFKPEIVISTIPSYEDNLFVVKKFKEKNKDIVVIVTAQNINEAIELYKNNADFVILPKFLAGQKIADYLVHLKQSEIKKWGKHYYNDLLEDNKDKIV